MTRRAVIAIAVVSAAVSIATIGSALGASLRQLSGARGCLTEFTTSGCGKARGVLTASWVTVSPDGRNVYMGAQGSGAVAVFVRNPGSGALAQLRGRAGCVAEHGLDGCAAGRNLAGARPVAVSPDGLNVYAGTFGGVVVFRRNPRSGKLTQLPGRAGCVQDQARARCAMGRGIAGVRGLAISSDGRTVYVAAEASSAVAVFARNLPSGVLRQLPGRMGCVSETPRKGCVLGRGLLGPRGAVISPDQRFLYVPSEAGNSVAVFARDLRKGSLTQLRGAHGCLQSSGAEGCASARALGSPHHISLSPDGRYAYVASAASNAVAVLRRDRGSGVLKQLTGTSGCVEQGGGGGCAPGRGLLGSHSIAISANGRMYVAAPLSNAIAVYSLDRHSGRLRQLAGTGGCIATGSSPGCATARGLLGAHSVALSPNCRNLYVASETGDGIAAFAVTPG